MKYYAVRNGKEIGIFDTWQECKKSIHKYKYAQYKSFHTLEEAKKYLKNKLSTNIDIKDEIFEEEENTIFVYTDGAVSNNGNKNAKAGIGVYFGENDKRNLSKRLYSRDKLTNNIAEIKAIISAYNILKNEINKGQNVTIVSDSKYAIRSVTSYGSKCELNNFKDIPNSQLVKKIYNFFKDKDNVRFIHINSHTGRTDGHYLGNHYADLLATKAIK
jgi:ribonuclease HI